MSGRYIQTSKKHYDHLEQQGGWFGLATTSKTESESGQRCRSFGLRSLFYFLGFSYTDHHSAFRSSDSIGKLELQQCHNPIEP